MRKWMLVFALLYPTSHAADVPVPYDYMGSLRRAEADVLAAEQRQDDSGKRAALSMLATQQSFVGDTERAIDTFKRAGYRAGGSRLSDAEAAKFIEEHEVCDAIEAILEQTRDRQIVIINEAHHVPRDRAFATLLALELRKRGFEYLAMETLVGDPAALLSRRYSRATDEDGYYNREPVFGDFIRRALAVGYTPVTYEARDIPPDLTGDARIDYREQKQAQNLVDRLLANNPKARILIHVGYGHLRKGVESLGSGKSRTYMAEYLKLKTGIDPYSIDQTQAIPANEIVADTILAKVGGTSFVLRSSGSEHPYSESAAVDTKVYHRPTALVNGRPDWLSMGGYRRPRAIPAKLLPASGRRLIQAFVRDESANAVPMDQVLVAAGDKPPVLMLPKGKYRYAFQE